QSMFVHLCTNSATPAFDDKFFSPGEYLANPDLQQRPALAVFCAPAARHFFVATNIGAEQKTPAETWVDYYKRVAPMKSKKTPGLVTFDAYSFDRYNSLKPGEEVGTLPMLLRWPLTIAQLQQHYKNMQIAAEYKVDEFKHSLYTAPSVRTINYGYRDGLVQQTDAHNCGPWACFLALGMVRCLVD